MKKNLAYLFLSVLASTTTLVSCNDNDINSPAVEEGDYIQFSIGQETESRTQYDSDDDWQIEWTDNDQIRIFSAEAKIGETYGQHAAYTVIPGDEEEVTITNKDNTTTTYSSNVKGTLKANDAGLLWGSSDSHSFYAVYPAATENVVTTSYNHSKPGIVTFNHIANQSITATETQEGSGIWTSTPEMSNAYMVAKAENISRDNFTTDSKIELLFKPIMTTLEITVMGSDTENIPATITGVSVVNTFESGKGIEVDGTFQYDIINGKVLTQDNAVSTMTTYIAINDVTLDKGDKLTLTAILPPIDLTTTNTTIIVHASRDYDMASGGSGIASAKLPESMILDTTTKVVVNASTKRKVTLPEITTPLTNNWITQLDGNIYVSQLSIPGTHDAATGNGSSWGDIGETQGLNLTQQLKMGIRAFDLRPAYVTESSTGVLRIYHGYAPTTEYWENALTTFKDYLTNNPGEFIIVVMREEEESSDEDSFDAKMQASLLALSQTTNTKVNKPYMATWKPDITIDDVRGQIIVLCRNWTPYTTTGYPLYGGAYMDWGHTDNCVTGNIWGTSDNGSTVFYLQDCYSVAETEAYNAHSHSILNGCSLAYCSAQKALAEKFGETKWTAVEKLLNITKTFHTDDNKKNHWAINHTSGYVGGK